MMKKVIFLSLFFYISCNEYTSLRQKCYMENSCDTAVQDCVIGANLIQGLLNRDSTSSQNQNSIFSVLYSPLICINAKQTCENDCNRTHPF
ncbi:LA_0364 family Cys-rich lipoprotein [Leptospira santarosai]|uniref:Lipoprotein n=1 Tax=Leptospira santarosai TaxID=28183 RepID=A0AB73MQ88_9LEPT|nr:hypothetical protein B2G51_00320 [Leptospira santarosai]ONF92619.1 hypothetical protein BWD14_11870 [Leptospira santarosai]